MEAHFLPIIPWGLYRSQALRVAGTSEITHGFIHGKTVMPTLVSWNPNSTHFPVYVKHVLSRGRTKLIFLKLSIRLVRRKSTTYLAFIYLHGYAFMYYTYIRIPPHIKNTAAGSTWDPDGTAEPRLPALHCEWGAIGSYSATVGWIMFWPCVMLTAKLQQAEESCILVSVSVLIFCFGLCYPSKLQDVLPMSFKCIVSCFHQKLRALGRALNGM